MEAQVHAFIAGQQPSKIKVPQMIMTSTLRNGKLIKHTLKKTGPSVSELKGILHASGVIFPRGHEANSHEADIVYEQQKRNYGVEEIMDERMLEQIEKDEQNYILDLIMDDWSGAINTI